jgi:hypothetical protein
MDVSRSAPTRSFFRNSRRNLHRADGQECRDWLKDTLEEQRLAVGEVAECADVTKRAAENLKAGENGMRMENLVAMCRNDPVFRAAFFEFCGGELDLPPDLTAVINAYMRRK